jgi:hypothetical protein
MINAFLEVQVIGTLIAVTALIANYLVDNQGN